MKTLHFPITVVDDFFEYPDAVREFALQQEYLPDPDNKWPGKRTKPLHELSPVLYNTTIAKVLSLFYDLKKIEVKWCVNARFQLVGEEYEEGWVHTDKENLITGIIYLSNQVCNSGTTLYRPIDPVNAVLKNTNKKHESFNNTDLVTSVKDFRLENNKQFRPTVTIESEYNRLVLFDSHLYHSANNFYGSGVESNRLTLVFFVNRLDFNTPMSEIIETPISRSRTFCL